MQTVFLSDGGRVIPGKCSDCGYDDDWTEENDVIKCSCKSCTGCGGFDGKHRSFCPTVEEEELG